MGKGMQIAIGAVTVFAGLLWWLSTSGPGEGTFAYYASVGEFTSVSTDPERPVRVHGFVQNGSIARDLGAGHVDFAIRDDSGATLLVRYQGIDVPDLFGDGAEVVIEGRSGSGDRFLADRVLAKCPSKYEPAARGREARGPRAAERGPGA